MATFSYMSDSALADLPQMFGHGAAMTAGLSDRTLAQLRSNGDIERLARGIYNKPSFDADPDLAEIAFRAPLATLCLTTALARHDLTDEIPPSINAALPRHYRSPKTAPPVTWHRFDDTTFDIGRDIFMITKDLSIGVYNPTRSIIDAYRLRHLYGTDQAHEALKRWLRQPGNHPSELLAMTKHFPNTAPMIRTTLEAIL